MPLSFPGTPVIHVSILLSIPITFIGIVIDALFLVVVLVILTASHVHAQRFENKITSATIPILTFQVKGWAYAGVEVTCS